MQLRGLQQWLKTLADSTHANAEANKTLADSADANAEANVATALADPTHASATGLISP